MAVPSVPAWAFSTNLRIMREAKGWGIREAAFRAGISRSCWGMIESRHREPLLSTALRMARALGVDVATLADWSPR